MSKIKTGICSYGMSGKLFHAPFINAHPGFNLYGVWERTKNLAAEKYPSIKTFRHLEDMLADEAIDLVVVNTPSITHYEFAKKVLEANKHLVVEKPFTATSEEAKELAALAQAKGKLLSVYHNRRYDSDFKTVKKILATGLLGDIKEAAISYDRFIPALSSKPHKEAPTPAVGIVYDLGSHLIDSALQLFGKPEAVFADIFRMRENTLVDDYFDLLFYYPHFRVRLKASFFAKEPAGFIIHGSKGSFIKSRSDIQETSLQAGVNPATGNWGTEPETAWGLLNTENGIQKIKSEPGNYFDYYEGIYQALLFNKPLPVKAEEAATVIAIIEAAYKSSNEKKVMVI